MNAISFSADTKTRVRLKEGETFFAAGDSFDRSISKLSDGAFKLFAHLCMRADRRTGKYEVTQKQLATSLNKSRRIIGCYAAEVRDKGVCTIQMGSNQFARTVFEICEDYWPYVRAEHSPLLPAVPTLAGDGSSSMNANSAPLTPDLNPSAYMEEVRRIFVTLGCTRGVFRSADEVIAESFFSRGIPLAVVADALAVGAVRKYVSWLNGNTGEAIASLKYFEAVVDELLENPLPLGYREYVKDKLKQLQERWHGQLQRARTL
jgi:hypothetical protein